MNPVYAPFPATRLRRTRATPALRALVRENALEVGDLIWPVFVRAGEGIEEPVPGIPIFGPRALSATKGSTHGKVFAQNLYPSAEGYPFLRCYAELPAVVPFSEFTTHTQSSGVLAYGFLAPGARRIANMEEKR